MVNLVSIPSTVEASRDLLGGCLSICAQSCGLAISSFNAVASLCKTKRKDNYNNILITGASSGIGKSLAIKFAKERVRRLVLLGRSREDLDETARLCTSLGSRVLIMTADFSKNEDLVSFREFVKEQDREHPFDLVIANASMMHQNTKDSVDESDKDITNAAFHGAIIDTNIKGMLATFMPILDAMKRRDNGHIVLLSSINAFLGPSNQYLYSATKSFTKSLGQDLSQQLRREKKNVLVSVVVPGLIDTQMTKPFWESEQDIDQSSMPRSLAQNSDKFAHKVYKGIIRGDGIITYPYYQFYQSYVLGSLPPTVRNIASCLITKSNFAGNRVT